MLPSLEYFEDKNIFSQKEVKTIVKKRKDTEYKLRGLNASPETFCECISYELKLEKLRRKRRKRLGIEKIQRGDHAIVSRIHHLFVRGLRKYGNDLSLWWYYFDFCSQSRSGSALSRAFTRCLQLHPLADNVWLRTANWEFFFNGDILGARKLLQRGLELNPSSCLLWKGFFKLEVKNVQKMRARAKVLKVSDKVNMEESTNKLIDEALIPQEIFKLALKQIPNNPQFLADLADLIPPVEYYPQLMKTAYQGICSLMEKPDVSGFVLKWLYSYHYQDKQSESEAWQKCFLDLNQCTLEFRKALVPELWSRLQSCEEEKAFKIVLKKLAEYIDGDEAPSLDTVAISLKINYLLSGDVKLTIAKLEEYKHLYKNDVQWWLLLVDLIRIQDDAEDYEKALWQAMLACGNDIRLLLCVADHAETKGYKEANQDFRKLTAKAMKNSTIHRRYFLWTLRNHPSSIDEVIYFLTTNACVSAETFCFFARECKNADLDAFLATKLLNQSCAIYGAKDPQCWLDLLKHLHDTGMMSEIPDVFRRAMAILENPAEFLNNATRYRS